MKFLTFIKRNWPVGDKNSPNHLVKGVVNCAIHYIGFYCNRKVLTLRT